MDDFFRLKHSFNAGDLIVVLAGLQNLYRTTGKKTRVYQRLFLPAFYYDGAPHPVTHNGQPVCMNEDIFNRLKPLIEAQEYIESFRIWKGEEVNYDIDLTRDSKIIPMPAGFIHTYAWSIYPELACDLSESWIDFEFPLPAVFGNKIIINRTERYTNPYITYFFLKEYQDNIMFSGTSNEHKLFCEQWGLNIELLVTNDFLQITRLIKACKFGIFNQSLHWHVADSMKCKRILELCPQFPNSFPTGKDGYAFYHQKNLEYYFQKLINEI
jgi:hypothetical protein